MSVKPAHHRLAGLAGLAAPLALLLVLPACGLREKLEQRAAEEFSERLIEGAAGGEVDVEIKDNKVVVKDKEGNEFRVDGEKGKVVTKDKDGKTITTTTDQKKGEVVMNSSDGSKMVAGKDLPEGIPVALPELAKVEMGSRMKLPDDKGTTWSAMFITESKDIDALTKHFEGEFTKKGLEPKIISRSAPIVGATITANDKEKGIVAQANLNEVKNDKDGHAGRFLVQFMYQDKNVK